MNNSQFSNSFILLHRKPFASPPPYQHHLIASSPSLHFQFASLIQTALGQKVHVCPSYNTCHTQFLPRLKSRHGYVATAPPVCLMHWPLWIRRSPYFQTRKTSRKFPGHLFPAKHYVSSQWLFFHFRSWQF